MSRLVGRVLDWHAKRRVLRMAGVSIHPDSKVNYRGIGPGLARLQIGSGSIVEGHVTADRPGAEVSIGNNTFFGRSRIISASRIDIGSDVLVSWGCYIVDHDSHPLSWELRRDDVRNWYVGKKVWDHVATAPVKIGDRAWIGFNTIVLKGVTIGDGSVIGAGSVVTRSIPANVVAAGNPARVIRTLSTND
jgi:acetyltransferase-like isoleucine patch superfamily enzyme